MTAAERAALLAIARAAVRAASAGDPAPPLPAELPGRLAAPAGAFVTLNAGSELRGCIGSVGPEGSLASLVARMAAASASKDPRFPPIRSEELPALSIEVSILSPAQRATPEEIEPGRHGVSLRLQRRRAVFLPQVATRHGWDRGRLLAELCRKAGLPASAWEDPATVLRVFTVSTIEGAMEPSAGED